MDTLGSARWAEEDDLRRAGMLCGRAGPILGRIFVPTDRPKMIRSLLSPRVPAYEACERCWRSFTRYREHVVRATQVIHSAVFAPSGQGKAVSLHSAVPEDLLRLLRRHRLQESWLWRRRNIAAVFSAIVPSSSTPSAS